MPKRKLIKCPQCKGAGSIPKKLWNDKSAEYICPVCKSAKKVPVGIKKIKPEENSAYELV